MPQQKIDGHRGLRVNCGSDLHYLHEWRIRWGRRPNRCVQSPWQMLSARYNTKYRDLVKKQEGRRRYTTWARTSAFVMVMVALFSTVGSASMYTTSAPCSATHRFFHSFRHCENKTAP
jgi:hypothetical protein